MSTVCDHDHARSGLHGSALSQALDAEIVAFIRADANRPLCLPG